MRFLPFLSAVVLAPIAGLAAPASHDEGLYKRENLCSLNAPPVLCKPNSSTSVEETALRAYKFYRAFVVDGDPRTMFSLIDSVYKVTLALSDRFAKKETKPITAKLPGIFERPPGHLDPLLRREKDRN
jgi:hypothetical protein